MAEQAALVALYQAALSLTAHLLEHCQGCAQWLQSLALDTANRPQSECTAQAHVEMLLEASAKVTTLSLPDFSQTL